MIMLVVVIVWIVLGVSGGCVAYAAANSRYPHLTRDIDTAGATIVMSFGPGAWVVAAVWIHVNGWHGFTWPGR